MSANVANCSYGINCIDGVRADISVSFMGIYLAA